jgi:hypothetical protein
MRFRSQSCSSVQLRCDPDLGYVARGSRVPSCDVRTVRCSVIRRRSGGRADLAHHVAGLGLRERTPRMVESRYRALVRLQACVRGYLFRKNVLWSPHRDRPSLLEARSPRRSATASAEITSRSYSKFVQRNLVRITFSGYPDC